MEKKFEILNYDELPKIKYNSNKEIINWKDINKGFIFKTNHKEYGYNEFEFIEKGINDDLFLKYNEKTFKTITYVFTKGGIGRIIGAVTKSFKLEAGKCLKDEKRNLVITDREYRLVEQKPDKQGRVYFKNEKWYKYTCNTCGWAEGWIPENNILKGTGCSCCANKTAVLGINTIWDTDRWMCDLGVSEEDAKRYIATSNQKITVKCPDCGSVKNIRIYNINRNKSIACNCGDGFSYPEKFMHNVLSQLKIKFETQYSPDYLIRIEGGKKSRKFSDFYLPEHSLVVETDGGIGHEGGNVHTKSKKTLDECIEIDKWKDEQHRLHGIETIRIDCKKSDVEYIKNSIMNSELARLFEFNDIDWLEADVYAVKNNKAKEIWEYWNNRNKNETTSDLVQMFGLSRYTILRYLKIGHKLNLCVYNKSEERKRAGKKIKKSQGKKIEIFKDNLSMGIFESATEVERKSLELFGTKLNHSSISATIKKKQKTHKGFTFKYVDE